QNLKRFVEALKELMVACSQGQGPLTVTDKINSLSEEICILSRRILFKIWPETDGPELTAAVIDLFLVAADHMPQSTPEYPYLTEYAANIRLRAEDLQPYVRQEDVMAN